MTEGRPDSTRLEDLLSQDTAVTSFQFEEFRMKLDESIQSLEQRARTVNRAALWGLGAIIICVLSAPFLELVGLWKYAWVPPLWSACGTIALFATGLLAGIYTYKYQPVLRKHRNDQQLAAIAHLQRQVTELSSKLESR